MCGIVGAIALKPGKLVNRVAVEALTDQLAYRGPDARGTAHEPGFSCGHRRLMVTDPLSRSDQPFWDSTGNVMVVFNGEIYNYRSVRRDLCARGARFRTDSDTEVLVEAYKQWGIECLSRLSGMFALALFDRRTQSFLIARDRLGVKPLYYAICNDLLLFGSEIKAVAGYPDFRRELVPEAVIRFLRFRYVPYGDQYYRGLRKLAAGCVLIVRDSQVTEKTYWDLPSADSPVDLDSVSLSSLIEESVKSQLRCDGPVALLLSGGVDSSVLAFHAQSGANSGLVTFTARIPGPAYDESALAAQVASVIGLEHRIVSIPSISNLDEVRKLIAIKDQPLGMHNELAMAQLARVIAEYSKVVLCGEGGDELFSGYARMFRSPFIFARRSLMQKLTHNQASNSNGVPGWIQDGFWQFVLANYFYIPDHDLQWLLRPELRPLCVDHELTEWLKKSSARYGGSRFQQITYFFLKLHLPGLLEMIDLATMSASLEARVPYTDHHLVEAAFALPESRKLRWRSPLHAAIAALLPLRVWSGRCDIPKAILYDAYRERLPEDIFQQQKKGFPVPLGKWLSENQEVHNLMLDRHSPLHEFFSPAELHSWYFRGVAQPDDTFGRRLWLLTNLVLFLEART